jgi:hypothetical protein
MRTYDLTPLWRSTVGFDRLLDLMREVPEAMKPRRIAIASGDAGNQQLEHKQAA